MLSNFISCLSGGYLLSLIHLKMESSINSFYQGLSKTLDSLVAEPDPIKRHDQSVKAIHQALANLKTFLHLNPIQTVMEEIQYFKYLAPLFYSEYFYHIKAYDVELLKRSTSKENIRAVLDHDLKEIDLFFARNADFCKYYHIGTTYLDEQIFTRHDGNRWPLDDLSFVIDTNFCLASYKISWILANEKYRRYLEQEIERLNNPENIIEQALNRDIWTWKGSKSDATELIVCMQLSEGIYINGRPASAAQLAEKFEKLLAMDLKDLKNLDYANRSRKKDMTPFMNGMIKKFLDRAIRLNK
jgi:hypothetical protein